jgi:hypothetical protein
VVRDDAERPALTTSPRLKVLSCVAHSKDMAGLRCGPLSSARPGEEAVHLSS